MPHTVLASGGINAALGTRGPATLRGAVERRGSRGRHIRTDFPDLDPALKVNFHVDGRMETWSEPC